MRTAKSMTKKDYIYCKDCKEYVDLWHYDCIEDSGHEKCNWRYVNAEELKECIKDCVHDGCFTEEGL